MEITKNSPINNVLFYFALTIIIFISIVSCNDRPPEAAVLVQKSILNGESRSGAPSFFDQKDKNQVTFTVIYDDPSGKMISDIDSEFNSILATYQLNITAPFQLDEENKGLVLVPTFQQINSIQIGKELSLLDEVLMVTISDPAQKRGIQ